MTNQVEAAAVELKSAIEGLLSQGKSPSYIRAVLADQLNISAKKMAELYKSLSPVTSNTKNDLVAFVTELRKSHDTNISRAALVTKLAEVSGYSEATANHMLSQLNFAKEYAQQEIAAMKKSK